MDGDGRLGSDCASPQQNHTIYSLQSIYRLDLLNSHLRLTLQCHQQLVRITKDMPRRHTSLLVQLRMRHVALNKYLHKIGKTNSPICPQCRSTQESVHLYLFRCPAFSEQRKRLEKRLKRGVNSIKTLLGGHKAMKHLFRYIHDMGRFEKSHGDVSLLMGKGRENEG
jgi:hypothetical protein